jgi:hypothetical protein
VGNSATILQSAEASREASYHARGEVYDTAVGTTGRQNAVTLDAGTREPAVAPRLASHTQVGSEASA